MEKERSFDRRSFCKGSAAAVAALGALSLAGCDENELQETAPEPGADFAANEEGAEWFAAPCWHNCGGRCVNKVLVKDGAVLRQKTDDTHEDSYDWPQSRGCLRGRSMQQQVFGADRVKYPMKRKNWSPDNPNGHLRGIDEWERISWEEALDYIANELKKAKEKYGNRSIYYMNLINLEHYMGTVLSAFGGYVDAYATQSNGTFTYPVAKFGVAPQQLLDRYDIENADYVIFWGHNPAWCAFGNPSYYIKHFKSVGVKFICVGPDYNATAAFTDAEWVPARPGTDTALILGVAHTMLTKDANGSLVDWDFLNRCTVGFDADHMPADAKTNENFLDYLMGKYDGVEKNAAWASEICGTPVELIEHLAEVLGCKNNCYISSSGAPARCKGSENYPQALMTLAAIGGHFGKSGNACALDISYSAFNRGPKIAANAYGGTPGQFSNAGNPVDDCFQLSEVWDNIVEGKYSYTGHHGIGQFFEPEDREIDIHVIIGETTNHLQTQPNINRGIEAFRKVDFVSSQVYSMKTDAVYSDIVLPICTRWEVDRDIFYSAFADKECAYAYRKIIDPLYEAKSDYEVAKGIAERLGLDFSQIIPVEEKQLWFNHLANATLLAQDGTVGPLVTITQEDLDNYGVQGNIQEGAVTLEKFISDGVYRVQRSKDDGYGFIAFEAFRQDPEANPIATSASGKLEIYCQAKADIFATINQGVDRFVEVSALPKYLRQNEGYEDIFTDWENKVAGPYPFQMTHAHYLRRAHSDMDNLPWTREAMVNPVFINKEDAAAKGIQTGDVILVHNNEGSFIRPATVTSIIMPGVILVPHGANVKIDEATGIDLAGADNVLTSSSRETSSGLCGWNSTLVDYEKYTGDIELLPDCEWPLNIPIAE